MIKLQANRNRLRTPTFNLLLQCTLFCGWKQRCNFEIVIPRYFSIAAGEFAISTRPHKGRVKKTGTFGNCAHFSPSSLASFGILKFPHMSCITWNLWLLLHHIALQCSVQCFTLIWGLQFCAPPWRMALVQCGALGNQIRGWKQLRWQAKARTLLAVKVNTRTNQPMATDQWPACVTYDDCSFTSTSGWPQQMCV